MKSKAINKLIIMIKLKIKKSFFPIYIKNLLSIKIRGRHSTTDVPKPNCSSIVQQNQDKKIQMFDFENLQYFFFSCFKAISVVLLI